MKCIEKIGAKFVLAFAWFCKMSTKFDLNFLWSRRYTEHMENQIKFRQLWRRYRRYTEHMENQIKFRQL
jgi:hypothetical protein